VGRAALCLVCEYAFDEWQLHKLIGEALSFNTAAIALYARLGFTEEGILRDHLCRDGRWVDVRAMALFEDGLEPVRATLAQLRSQGRVA
jgi:RimJ/RimL family protein N-acetyltransferase